MIVVVRQIYCGHRVLTSRYRHMRNVIGTSWIGSILIGMGREERWHLDEILNRSGAQQTSVVVLRVQHNACAKVLVHINIEAGTHSILTESCSTKCSLLVSIGTEIGRAHV